ncbi:MAG: hypothetical protein AAFP84_16075, partial [Actinomycetota bacterium]
MRKPREQRGGGGRGHDGNATRNGGAHRCGARQHGAGHDDCAGHHCPCDNGATGYGGTRVDRCPTDDEAVSHPTRTHHGGANGHDTGSGARADNLRL